MTVTSEALAVSQACRDLRHAWDAIGDTILIEQNGQVRHFARTLRCFRCETERVDEYKISNVALARVRTRYFYIPGYQIRGGIELSELRFRLFKDIQMVPQEEESDE
jgi:hypothetical protein